VHNLYGCRGDEEDSRAGPYPDAELPYLYREVEQIWIGFIGGVPRPPDRELTTYPSDMQRPVHTSLELRSDRSASPDTASL
jgi:hypothetical protein